MIRALNHLLGGKFSNTFVRVNTVPLEILCNILREATFVSEALDTSSIYFENRATIVQLICESMKTKNSLSLVSKTFHYAMENYLYEIVMIFRFDYVPVLLQRLRSIPAGYQSPRGHLCKRLDLYLGIGTVPYGDEAWYEGGHTLWGLIPACPNLEILMARVVCSAATPHPTATWNCPHLTHKALWMTIAACCAKTIRRLELYGFRIRIDRVEVMLRYLSKLEACTIVHAVQFNPSEDVYDDEEPKMYIIPGGRCRASMFLADDWDYTTPSGWFDTSTVSEFKAAKENSTWPPFVASTPYILPCLHTLRLSRLDLKRMNQFDFPRLRHLNMPCSLNGGNLSRSWGFIPDSVTHLTYAGEDSSFAQIINFFPYLQFLVLVTELSAFPESEYTTSHSNLEVVELATWENISKPLPRIAEILVAVRAGILPKLCMIQITRPWSYDDAALLPFRECEDLGVELKVVVREEPVFRFMSSRYQNQTWTTLSVFFLAMVLHPECQKRAQQEIDSVVGPGRLPEFSDRESLPYIGCILQETLRWNPVVPLAGARNLVHRRATPFFGR
ncbi:hypothetical protein C0995_014221 [Termitomyces sp. Mi166|nr:hypothetical protein C0995_014221 [Termitomyces sp. Mi166\